MAPRRPRATAESKARAARIAAALEGLLDDLPPPPDLGEPSAPTTSNAPYRPMPRAPRPSGRRRGVDCPACHDPMELDFERGVEIHRCIGCAGLWLDPGELDSLVDDPGPRDADLPTLRAGMKEVQVRSGPVQYRKCPRCEDVMLRRNFGTHSGVIVDECRAHGLYLDPGEFEAIEQFIKLGGLALERSRELRNAKRDAHQAKIDADYYQRLASSRTQYGHHRQHTSSWGNLFTWLDGLFVFLLLFVP